jgi:SAM-dependent methyltransferase
VITDQALEHLADPRRAVQEAYRVLRPGGLAVHTTRFLNPVHPSPRDYFHSHLMGWRRSVHRTTRSFAVRRGGTGVALYPASSSRSDTLHRYPGEVQSSPLVGDADETKYPIVKWILMRKPGEHDDA